MSHLTWDQLSNLDDWPPGFDIDHVRALRPILQRMMQPARADEIAVQVEFLQSFYRSKPNLPQFADAEKRAWLAVLGHWPADIMEAAVKQWISEDRAFPPSVPGELKAVGEPIFCARKALFDVSERLLGAKDKPHEPEKQSPEVRALIAKGLRALAKGDYETAWAVNRELKVTP